AFLERWAALVLTGECLSMSSSRYPQETGGVMSEPSKTQENRDSVVDARAAFVLILLVVATAVFWVSHQ
ncbi:hypothetical protein, partial [Acinetobacter nosocomialis]